MAVFLILFSLISLFGAYFFVIKRTESLCVGQRVNRPSPARRYNDGEDFVPSKPLVVFGYHFKSIGLDPIIGPVIAIQFGWLPAIVWVISGFLFIGWVQNYLTTIISMRNKGASLADLAGKLISPRSRKVLLSFIYLYLLIIMSGLSSIMAPLIVRENVPVGFISLVLVGLLAGQMIYRWRIGVLPTTLISLPIAFVGVFISASPTSTSVIRGINQIGSNLGGGVLFTRPLDYGELTLPFFLGIAIIMAFCYLGAVKPIWRYSQPINYIAFWFITIVIVGAVTGIFISAYQGDLSHSFEIPAIVSTFQPSIGPLWPMLFVTISCGAVSGWHALVSTFSTSRQIEKESHVLPVTAGASLTQSFLVIVGIIFAASLGVSAARFNPEQNFQLVAGPAGVFANGLIHFLSVVGLPLDLGDAISAIFVTIMAVTVLPLVLRFMRMTGAELFGERIPVMKNPKTGTVVAIAFSLIVVILGFWQWIWVLFGSASQILAASALLLAAIWLAEQGKGYKLVLIPSFFLFATSTIALLYVSVYKALYLGILSVSEQSPGLTIGHLISACTGLMILVLSMNFLGEGMRSLSKLRSKSVRTSIAIYDQI